MFFNKVNTKYKKIEQIFFLIYTLKWLFFATLIGALTGSSSAFFLKSLEWASKYREDNFWIIALLPIGGFIIGLLYHYFGKSVVRGNNQLLDEYHKPERTIPFKMAPLVYLGTIITHLFGGSAGREGTAVQIGGAIADQFSKPFKLTKEDRKTLIMMGISAGFSSVFGTPLAGAVFAIEVLIIGKSKYESIIPVFLVAILANYFCDLWNINHTHYHIPNIPNITLQNLFYTILIGIASGFTALLFSKMVHFWSSLFKGKIKYPPFRPLIGGIVIASIVFISQNTKYIGLGIPTIVNAFHYNLNSYDFLLKIIFTTFTLGAGFKGGEVTPLFWIGATLGNALAFFIPLPLALMTGIGFVAVFSGATNTPIACTIMGIELFGIEAGVFLSIGCVFAYMFSGHNGIYSSQIIGKPKHKIFKKYSGKNLKEL